MTAPHPLPRLVVLATLAALLFTLMALLAPSAISGLDLGSGGHSAAPGSGGHSAPAIATPHTGVAAPADNVFHRPLTSPLRLMAQPAR